MRRGDSPPPSSSLGTAYEVQYSSLAVSESRTASLPAKHDERKPPFLPSGTGVTGEDESSSFSFLLCGAVRTPAEEEQNLRREIDARRVRNLRDEVDFRV